MSHLVRLGAPPPPDVAAAWTSLSRARAGGVTVPVGAVLLAPDLGPLRGGERVHVRSAVRRDRTPPPLSTDDPAALAEALALAWADGGAGQVLVCRAPEAVHAGTARLRAGGRCDEVTAYEVTEEARLVPARARRLLAPRLRPVQRPHRDGGRWATPLPPWGERLSRLLRAARPYADGADVEWADDGRRCWLMAIHPDGGP